MNASLRAQLDQDVDPAVVAERARLRAQAALCDRPEDEPEDTYGSGASTNGATPSTAAGHWLEGVPMNPHAAPREPIKALEGLPITYPGACTVLVGPTGGGRSMLLQACLYDSSLAGLRGAYLGCEIVEDEFHARAAEIAECRGDRIGDELLALLAEVRYHDLASTIVHASAHPDEWAAEIAARYDWIGIDPLSAVAAALDRDFENNAEYVAFHARLIEPLTRQGVPVVLVDNVGHGDTARTRAKGASAKQDKADVLLTCTAISGGLAIQARKVRSIRAPIRKGDEWTFDRATLRIAPRTTSTPEPERPAFRPTTIMQRVSEVVERDAGLSQTAIRAAVGSRAEHVRLALQLLISEGYVAAEKDGQTHTHRSLRPYRQDTDEQLQLDPDPPTASTASPPRPHPVPDAVPGTASTASLPERDAGPDPVLTGHANRVPADRHSDGPESRKP
jgi:hypothetical protein